MASNWFASRAAVRITIHTSRALQPFRRQDGYLPPEDPLIGVARHIAVTAALKSTAPNSLFVGSGYSYLQDWLPNVAQYTVQHGLTDFVGIGRMVLSYPEMVADVLAGRPLQRKLICRTFSDCTTAPRNGMISAATRSTITTRHVLNQSRWLKSKADKGNSMTKYRVAFIGTGGDFAQPFGSYRRKW